MASAKQRWRASQKAEQQAEMASQLARWEDHHLDKLAEAVAAVCSQLAIYAHESEEEQAVIDRWDKLADTVRHLGIPF